MILWLNVRVDTVVEVEDAQVRRFGGRIEPAAGTFSRYLLPNGWRVGDREGVLVPLRLPANAKVRVEGWLDSELTEAVELRAGWDGAIPSGVGVGLDPRGGVHVPTPQNSGRHLLRLELIAPSGVTAVLDRVVVER